MEQAFVQREGAEPSGTGGLPGADEFVFRLFGALRYDEFAAECEI